MSAPRVSVARIQGLLLLVLRRCVGVRVRYSCVSWYPMRCCISSRVPL